MSVHKQQVETFYSEIWNNKNLTLIPEVLDENVCFVGSLGVEKHGHQGFIDYHEYIHSRLESYQCVIEQLVEDSNKVFAKMLFCGVHVAEFLGYAATNKQVCWQGAALFTFAQQKIVDIWVLGDIKGLESQLKSDD